MKEQEVTSLTHKVSVLEGQLEKTEHQLADAKKGNEHSAATSQSAASMERKIDTLSNELDEADRRMKEYAMK
jgi:tropomyosin